jgi:excisionase family DNA binding protein
MGDKQMTTTTTKLLNKAQLLAHALRREGRRADAQTVEELLQAIASDSTGEGGNSVPFLTTGEVAQHVGVSRQTIVNWVKKGILPGVRLGGRTLIAATALQRFGKLEAVLNEFDAERPSATATEAERN